VTGRKIGQAVRVPSDPEQIKREIEEIRAELAATVEEITQRMSPKAVAGRGVSATREWFGFTPEAGHPNGQGGHHPTPAAQRVRWERVALVVAVVGLLVVRRARKHRRS
jgi:hypothetical protein